MYIQCVNTLDFNFIGRNPSNNLRLSRYFTFLKNGNFTTTTRRNVHKRICIYILRILNTKIF